MTFQSLYFQGWHNRLVKNPLDIGRWSCSVHCSWMLSKSHGPPKCEFPDDVGKKWKVSSTFKITKSAVRQLQTLFPIMLNEKHNNFPFFFLVGILFPWESTGKEETRSRGQKVKRCSKSTLLFFPCYLMHGIFWTSQSKSVCGRHKGLWE